MKKKNIVFVVSLLIDILSKVVIYSFLNDEVKLFKGFYFKLVYNTGCAFSFLENNNYLLIVIGIIMLYLIYRMSKDFDNSNLNNIAFGLLYGGIVGNLLNRIFFGYVIDFIKVVIYKYNFPIFNLADSFIVIGVGILLYDTFIKGEKDGSNSRK